MFDISTTALYFIVLLLLTGILALGGFIAFLKSLNRGIERERHDNQLRYGEFDDGVRLPDAGYGEDPGYDNEQLRYVPGEGYGYYGPDGEFYSKEHYRFNEEEDPLYEPYDYRRDTFRYSDDPGHDVTDRWG